MTPSPGRHSRQRAEPIRSSAFTTAATGSPNSTSAAVERAGAVIAARASNMGVEAIELPGHPFFVATAFQPQVGASVTGKLHPLLDA